jgi:rod shape-determining protein MreD
MNKLVWQNIGRFLLLVLFQELVLNNVYLGGYIMPMLYVLFILMLPTGMKRIPLLLIAFGTGLLIDIMSNMLGFHALACTVVAMMRIWFADRILTRGEPVQINVPSIYSVTPQYFVSYLLLMLAVFYFLFFLVELWGFRGFGDVLLATLLSTLTTALLSILCQIVFLKRKEEV